VVGLGDLSPCPHTAGQPGAAWSGVCVHPGHACAAVTLQRLLSGGFLGNQHEEGAFPRQLQPRWVVTRARLGAVAFPGAELLQLGVGKRDASAGSRQLLPAAQKAFALLLWRACRP